jgi:mono/diheme cytochrome c family protein
MQHRLSGTLFLILIVGLSGFAVGQSGVEVFDIRCAKCHGADGAGKTGAAEKLNGIPDLRSKAVQSKSDTQLFDSIGRGTDHKKYPHVFLQTGVTQTQIAQIVAYLRVLAKR